SPNVQLIFFAHLLTRRAVIEPVTLAWHDMPTSATFESPISAALMRASGLGVPLAFVRELRGEGAVDLARAQAPDQQRRDDAAVLPLHQGLGHRRACQ